MLTINSLSPQEFPDVYWLIVHSFTANLYLLFFLICVKQVEAELGLARRLLLAVGAADQLGQQVQLSLGQRVGIRGVLEQIQKKDFMIYHPLSARLQYLQCVSHGNTAVFQ